MSSIISFAVAMAMASLVVVSPPRPEPHVLVVQCIPLDSTSLSAARRIVSAADYQDLRDSLPLPLLPGTSVRHVADSSICNAAAAAVAAAYDLDPHLVEGVAVYRLGENHFAVRSPQAKVGSWSGMLIFSRDWHLLGTILL